MQKKFDNELKTLLNQITEENNNLKETNKKINEEYEELNKTYRVLINLNEFSLIKRNWKRITKMKTKNY